MEENLFLKYKWSLSRDYCSSTLIYQYRTFWIITLNHFCVGIIPYLHRVSVPSSELAPTALSPASECVPPLEPKGGWQHSLAGEGTGRAKSDDRRESWHSVYSEHVCMFASILLIFKRHPNALQWIKLNHANKFLLLFFKLCPGWSIKIAKPYHLWIPQMATIHWWMLNKLRADSA